MTFKTRLTTVGKGKMMAAVLALMALWATVAIAGKTEDLLAAAARGDLRGVKLLIANGAEVNARDENGNTALMLASVFDRAQVVQFLLAQGAEVNNKNHDGFTALMAASGSSGHLAVVQALLAQGAEVNARDMHGRTALTIATDRGYKEVRELLLRAGATDLPAARPKTPGAEEKKSKEEGTSPGKQQPETTHKSWQLRNR